MGPGGEVGLLFLSKNELEAVRPLLRETVPYSALLPSRSIYFSGVPGRWSAAKAAGDRTFHLDFRLRGFAFKS